MCCSTSRSSRRTRCSTIKTQIVRTGASRATRARAAGGCFTLSLWLAATWGLEGAGQLLERVYALENATQRGAPHTTARAGSVAAAAEAEHQGAEKDARAREEAVRLPKKLLPTYRGG
jgi:hypothetical protein